MRAPDFCRDGYADLLDELAAVGYSARSFHDYDPAARHLLLRHDLDMSLQAAVATGEIEAARGWSSTCFVLLRTEMYNPLSRAGAEALERLAAQGHEIGLHFDASLYPDQWEALDVAAARECDLLEQVVGRPVRIISFHRPARSLLGRPEPLAGRPHAYMPRYFSDIGYCSDSQGAWRFGAPRDHAAVAAGTALQLLTHPIWWDSVDAPAPVPRLEAWAEGRRQLIRSELAANCQPFAAAWRQM